MDVRHQYFINNNMTVLVEETKNVDRILGCLVRSGIITRASADEILRSSSDGAERARHLYRLIKRCGPWAFTALIESLNETENEVVALLLKENRMWNNTPPGGSPIEESMTIEENMPFLLKKLYLVKSDPRGSVLIVNVFQYDHKWREQRDGSLKDVEDLETLFNDMGYRVTKSPAGGSKKDIEEAIKEWRTDTFLTGVDCGILIIMAHGTEAVTGSVLIETSDMKTIDSESIINDLSSSEAPLLHGKPKLIFILSCRGKYPDMGTDIERVHQIQDERNRNNPSAQLEAAPMNFDAQGHFEGYAPASPFLKDILVIYPCAPGMASLRDPQLGAWFVQEMIKVFRKRAHHDDVETMLKEVDRNLIQQRQQGIKDSFQTVCCTSRGFSRVLYLNPISSFSSSSIFDSRDIQRPSSSNGNYT